MSSLSGGGRGPAGRAARLRAAAPPGEEGAAGRARPPLAHSGGRAAGTRAEGAGRGPADTSAGGCGPWRPGPSPPAAPARPGAPELRLGAHGASARQEVGPGRGTEEGTRGGVGKRGDGRSCPNPELGSGSLQTKDWVSRVRTWGPRRLSPTCETGAKCCPDVLPGTREAVVPRLGNLQKPGRASALRRACRRGAGESVCVCVYRKKFAVLRKQGGKDDCMILFLPLFPSGWSWD